MKICTHCKVEKEAKDFYGSDRTSHGLSSWCKQCLLESHQTPEYKEIRNKSRRTPEFREKNREKHMKEHGISLKDFEARLKSQNGNCAICGTSTPGGKGGFHIDHDHNCCDKPHSCGKCIRGLLCNRCNMGLGVFNDDITILKKAILYLEK